MPTAATSAIDRVEKALEDLRFQFLHSSSGLPLPSIRQLNALARLRPSAIQSLPHNVIPTWSPEQTKIFGEVFLRKAREVSLSLALPLDIYQCDPSSPSPAASIPPSSNSKKRKKVEVHHVEITNAFRKGVDTRQIAQSHQILEEKVFHYLIEAEQCGIDVNWGQLKLDRRLYESVGLAVDIVKEMEGGQRDPLALDFPVATLKQLLPGATGIEVSAALCKLRHQCQYGISPPSLRNRWTAPVSSSVPSSSSRPATAAAVSTNNSTRPMPLQRHQQQQHPQAKSHLGPQDQAAVATHSNSSNTRPVPQQTKSRLGAQGQSATSSAATVAVATTTKTAASTINQATAMEVVGEKRCPEVLLGNTSGDIRAMPIQQQQQQQQQKQRRSYLNLQSQSTSTSSLAVAAVATATKAGTSPIMNQATEMEVEGKKRCAEVLKTLPSEVPPYKAARRPLGNLQHSHQQQQQPRPPEPYHFPQSQPTPLPPRSSLSLSSSRPPPSRTSSWPPPPTLPSSSSYLNLYQHPISRPASFATGQSNSNNSRIIPTYQPDKASSSSPALPLMKTATAAASHPPPFTAIDSKPSQLHALAHLHHPTRSSTGATTTGQSHPSSTASLNPTIAPYKPGSNRGPPSSSAAAAPALSFKGSVPSISSASISHPPPPPPSSLFTTSATTLPPAAHPPPHQQQQQQYQEQQHEHQHQQQLQQQPQQQHQHQQQQQQQRQQQQQEQQAITAAPMSLKDRVVDALQANASEGLTVQEVCHQVMMKGRGGGGGGGGGGEGQGISYQAVESCLVDMSDNFEAYIHGGKFKIL